jgi:two-component system, OmpR family, response regulator AdeR
MILLAKEEVGGGAAILVSDDEPLVVSALARHVVEMGVSVICDVASKVADLASRYRPALILLDLAQEVDGRELLAQLKRDDRTSDVEVIVMSANDDPEVIAECFQLGAADYELKPFSKSFCRRIADRARRITERQQAPESVH